MIIKVNYTVSDVYMSTSISPVYIKVVYSGVSGGGGTWGSITGTLSNQTDLQGALDNKVPYTGATGAVNLGAYDLTVNSLAVGRGAGAYINNTVLGSQAGGAFTTAQTNVAIGEQSLKVHSTGNGNTAVGRYSMLTDVDGSNNTALGASSLVFLASGGNTGNTAIGVNGLARLTTGNYNTWLGYSAGPGGILTSGSYNTILGAQVNVGVATLNNNIILADGQGNIRFRDDATSTILSRLAGVGTRMVVTDTNGALSTQAIPSVSGYVPYTGATSDLNLGSYNLLTNNVFTGFTSITASATQLVLTINSVPEILVTGSGGQTIKLPDATTLQNGATYRFNNNQSSGAISVNNNSNTLVASIPSGGYVDIVLLSNSIAAGSWDRHDLAPSNVSWSTNTLDYAGSITSATWNGVAVAVNRGGTGATTSGAALTNLGAQAALTLTTTGTSGAATLVGSTLNIPQYSGGGGSMAIGGSITSATAGSVLFAGTSGVLQQDNANLFWDDTNNRLGIGTSSPTSKLDIQGITESDGGQLGSELTTTGSGTNWSGTSFTTGYTHTAGSGAALTTSLAAVIGTYYYTSYVITGRTTGTFVISYGGVNSANLSATGANGFKATATTTLSITPSSDFNGTIVLSIKVVTAGLSSLILKNSSGTITNEFRASSSNSNLFIGFEAGAYNQNGINNTAIGSQALKFNISGSNNFAIGYQNLQNNSNGANNTAVGYSVMINNSTGSDNTSVGFASMYSSTTSLYNSAFGRDSLYGLTTGQYNTAIGWQSMLTAISTTRNTAIGYQSLYLTTANNNVAVGGESLYNNSTGANNVAVGLAAGKFIANGSTANAITNTSIFIGNTTKALANNQTNQIVIGYDTTGLGSNTTVIGNSSTTDTAIYGRMLVNYSAPVIGTFGIDVNGTARIVSKLTLGAGTTSNAQINLISSTAPTSPNNGDIWFDGTDLKMRIGGVTKTFTLI